MAVAVKCRTESDMDGVCDVLHEIARLGKVEESVREARASFGYSRALHFISPAENCETDFVRGTEFVRTA